MRCIVGVRGMSLCRLAVHLGHLSENTRMQTDAASVRALGSNAGPAKQEAEVLPTRLSFFIDGGFAVSFLGEEG